jgi:hypothetical protein
MLGASGVAVGTASGLGELAGYALRLVSGPVASRTRAYWPITIAGYIIQMAAAIATMVPTERRATTIEEKFKKNSSFCY